LWPRISKTSAAMIAVVGVIFLGTDVRALDLRGTIWESSARKEGIDPHLLFSVALVESGYGTSRFVRPWPWALTTPKGDHYDLSREGARKRLLNMSSFERERTAVGMMQIYVKSHSHRVRRTEDLLDPVRNIEIGASILRESIMSSPGNLVYGVGRYNAWTNREAAVNYGRRVLKIYNKIRKRDDDLPLRSLWESDND